MSDIKNATISNELIKKRLIKKIELNGLTNTAIAKKVGIRS